MLYVSYYVFTHCVPSGMFCIMLCSVCYHVLYCVSNLYFRRKSLQKQGSLCDDHEFDELKSSASMLCTSHNSLDQHSMHGDGGQQPDCHNSMSPSVTDCHKSRLGVTTPSRCGVTTPSHLRARHSITSQSQSRSKLMRRSSVECYELDHAKSSLAPEVEGRIFMITPQVKLVQHFP